MAEEGGVEINSLHLFDKARETITNAEVKPFLDNVVGVIAHCLAEHSEPPRVLSEADHDLIRLAASVAMLANAILEEGGQID